MKGEVAYTRWFSRRSVYIRGADLLITMKSQEAYCYGVITKSSMRGQGIYKSAQVQMIQLAPQLSIRRMIAYVEADNPIPQAIYSKLGYGVTPLIVSRRIGGIRFGNRFDSSTCKIVPQIMNGAEKRYYWI